MIGLSRDQTVMVSPSIFLPSTQAHASIITSLHGTLKSWPRSTGDALIWDSTPSPRQCTTTFSARGFFSSSLCLCPLHFYVPSPELTSFRLRPFGAFSDRILNSQPQKFPPPKTRTAPVHPGYLPATAQSQTTRWISTRLRLMVTSESHARPFRSQATRTNPTAMALSH